MTEIKKTAAVKIAAGFFVFKIMLKHSFGYFDWYSE